MEKLRFMRGAAALLAGSAMLFASCSDDDAPMAPARSAPAPAKKKPVLQSLDDDSDIPF